jgi:hypothetical protein
MVSSSSAVVTSAGDDSRRLISGPVRQLVLGSALMLFVELALIQWLGANIVHLSYFTNFVLLGSFLGIGVGFLISRKTWSLLPWSPVVLALLVVAVLALPVSIDRDRLRRTGHHATAAGVPGRGARRGRAGRRDRAGGQHLTGASRRRVGRQHAHQARPGRQPAHRGAPAVPATAPAQTRIASSRRHTGSQSNAATTTWAPSTCSSS